WRRSTWCSGAAGPRAVHSHPGRRRTAAAEAVATAGAVGTAGAGSRTVGRWRAVGSDLGSRRIQGGWSPGLLVISEGKAGMVGRNGYHARVTDWGRQPRRRRPPRVFRG